MADTAYLDEIKQTYCRGLNEDEYDYFEERAGILEHDAGMERWRAEEWAMKSVEAKRFREEMERERNAKNA